MTMQEKSSKVAYAKSINKDLKTATAYVSTFGWDRTDERFEKGAWDLGHYKNNPVVMWGHDYKMPPIGKAIKIEEDQNGLLAETQFADSDFAQEIFKLYDGGFLSAFSVGFAPKDGREEAIEGGNRKGFVYTKADLLEYSAVSIPANPGALVGRELAMIAQKTCPTSILEVKTADGIKFLAVDPLAQIDAKPLGLEDSLKSLTELCRTVKGQKLPASQLSLITTANILFQEIIADNTEGVDAETVAKLRGMVGQCGEIIKNLYPDASLTVRRAMNQIDKALAAR
jgi:HK97 family phage prohead protease